MNKFEWYVQAMAQPYEVQMKLFPPFVEVADELALGWEETAACYLDGTVELEDNQRDSIRKLDEYIESISGPKNIAYWTVEALLMSAEWQTIRLLSKGVLVAMKWEQEIPPVSNDIFIGR